MLNVTVDRSRWLHGEGCANSQLLREEDGKMCCLGFACETVNIPTEDFVGRRTPENVPAFLPGLAARAFPDEGESPDRIVSQYEGVAAEKIYGVLMDINDTNYGDMLNDDSVNMIAGVDSDFIDGDGGLPMADATRERLIQKVGLLVGINFDFTDGGAGAEG